MADPALPPPPFQVRTSGLIRNQPYHSSPGTKQNDWMLSVILSGRGDYRNRAGAIELRRGMVGLVPPQDAGVMMADPQDPYAYYFCRFSGSYALQLGCAILARRGRRFFLASNHADVAAAIRGMGQRIDRELPREFGRREALLAQALAALWEDIRHPERTQDLNEASLLRYLEDRMTEATDLSAAAEHFHVSKTTLCRKSRQLCGATLQRLHERIKMDWAQTLLASGYLNISAVARRVGYRDPLYFSRVFRKHAGIAPRAWSVRKRASARVRRGPLR